MYKQSGYKIVVIGDSGTGKTSLVDRLTKKCFDPSTQPTIGAEFKSYIALLDEEEVKLNIWDTAGQERYRSVSKSYFRGTVGALLVFSISEQETFASVEKWLDDIQANCLPNSAILLIGNKSDLENERQVTYDEAFQLAKRHGISYIETSALSDTNVVESFHRLAKLINDKTKSGEIKGDFAAPISLMKTVPEAKKKSGCC